MPTCVAGPGAVGLYLAAELGRRQTVFLLGKEKHRAALQAGIQVEGAREFSISSQQAVFISHDQTLSGFPIFWICVKGTDLPALLEESGPRLGENTIVAVLSNGLGIYDETVSRLKRPLPVVRVCVGTGVRKTAGNRVRLAGEAVFTVSSSPEHARYRDRVCESLRLFADSVVIKPSPAAAEWEKIAVNLLVNSLCTLLNRPNKALLRNSALHSLAGDMLQEIEAVMKQKDLQLPFGFEELLGKVGAFGENINSTLIDLRTGRKSETEIIFGRFLQEAKTAGVPAPKIAAVYDLLRAFEDLGILREQ